MLQTQTVHINFTGGIVSPGYLKTILEISAAANIQQVRFGLRQQLIIDVPAKSFSVFEEACADKQIAFLHKKDALPNIISSYPAAGIFTTDTWLREGVYKDVFDLFDYKPTLKINIADSTQSLVPFFTGHLNLISSEAAHFWHLYIRFPRTQILYHYPELIYTNDIALVTKEIERLLLEQQYLMDGDELFAEVKKNIIYVAKEIEKELIIPKFSLPYYEGFNKHEGDYWLGIYRRDEIYPVAFLLDVCAICMQTKIGQLYTTPWKSVIIKGIDAPHRHLWDYVLGKYRINVRHAANELNWQVEDNNEEGLLLKRQIIRHFDKEDVRTFGLCFAVQIYPHTGMFGSVIIKKQMVRNPDKLKSLERFEIIHSPTFNPNSFQGVSFRQNVEKEFLGPYLAALCKFFYAQQSNQSALVAASPAPGHEIAKPVTSKLLHQCCHCLTVYDDSFGDAENNIAPGTPFRALPASYQCPLCEAQKSDFKEVNESSLKLQAT